MGDCSSSLCILRSSVVLLTLVLLLLVALAEPRRGQGRMRSMRPKGSPLEDAIRHEGEKAASDRKSSREGKRKLLLCTR